MTTTKSSDRIAKIAKQRESLKKQLDETNKKIAQKEATLAKEIGEIALRYNLDLLGHDALISAFEKIAKSHNLT